MRLLHSKVAEFWHAHFRRTKWQSFCFCDLAWELPPLHPLANGVTDLARFKGRGREFYLSMVAMAVAEFKKSTWVRGIVTSLFREVAKIKVPERRYLHLY